MRALLIIAFASFATQLPARDVAPPESPVHARACPGENRAGVLPRSGDSTPQLLSSLQSIA